MLFNSFTFIFVFMPIVVAAYAALGRLQAFGTARAWLLAASLFFYGWWNPAYLGLIAASIVGNYGIAKLIARDPASRAGWWLTAGGVAANLTALGYYKYVGFFDRALGLGLDLGTIVLPLAISFFTFTQIAYLVDVRTRRTAPSGLIDYALFVTFFPHLVAGPIVHEREVMPQFRQGGFRLHMPDVVLGIAIFVIGLAKKTLIADPAAIIADIVFATTSTPVLLGAVDAWAGVLAYAVQLYFDFSGYSDMAIGLARIFSVKFPANFDSPYQATSIIDFWRRWHITLSLFLRDYLYIPLGGSRHGSVRRYVNLFVTMLLGGLWHGAHATFVAWGALHGAYLIVNHGWRNLRAWLPASVALDRANALLAWPLTFTAVLVGWVFFRAPGLAAAGHMLQAMAGFNGLGGFVYAHHPELVFVALGLMIAFFAPNTQTLLAPRDPVLEAVPASRWSIRLDVRTGLVLGVLLFLACRPFASARPSVFLYFNF